MGAGQDELRVALSPAEGTLDSVGSIEELIANHLNHVWDISSELIHGEKHLW
jgi:hypothetical protein